MKTTALGSKLARLHSGIGAAIASLAAARGLDKAVAELAFNGAQRRGRSRIPGPRATGWLETDSQGGRRSDHAPPFGLAYRIDFLIDS